MAYQRSVVTFVDILGFSDLVERLCADEVTEMLDAIGATAAQSVGAEDQKTGVLSFSDSVIRSRPIATETVYDALLHEIQQLATAQWTLLEFGMLIRGGTTVGEISLEGGRAFGPAFIRAYRLEFSLAGSPRIVIDPTVIESIRRHLRTIASRGRKRSAIADLKNHIRLGDDGIWFVDYMSSITLMNDRAYVLSALVGMREFIIGEVHKLSPNSLVLAKHLWLIRYHNQSVRRLFPEQPALIIRSADVPEADELLKPRMIRKPR